MTQPLSPGWPTRGPTPAPTTTTAASTAARQATATVTATWPPTADQVTQTKSKQLTLAGSGGEAS